MMDKESELEHLKQHLQYTVEMINNNFSLYRASIDNSGLIPQISITKNDQW